MCKQVICCLIILWKSKRKEEPMLGNLMGNWACWPYPTPLCGRLSVVVLLCWRVLTPWGFRDSNGIVMVLMRVRTIYLKHPMFLLMLWSFPWTGGYAKKTPRSLVYCDSVLKLLHLDNILCAWRFFKNLSFKCLSSLIMLMMESGQCKRKASASLT